MSSKTAIFGLALTLVRCSLVWCSIASSVCLEAYGRTPCPSEQKLVLPAALVLTPEFCATKIVKGVRGVNHETFEIGKAACTELEPRLGNVFSALVRVEQPSSAADAQVFLTPKFLDSHATQTMFALANRELLIWMEWTAEDASGKIVWVETVQGSAKHVQGNAFTHAVQLKRIVRDSVKDLAEQSAKGMLRSSALRKLSNAACDSGK